METRVLYQNVAPLEEKPARKMQIQHETLYSWKKERFSCFCITFYFMKGTSLAKPRSRNLNHRQGGSLILHLTHHKAASEANNWRGLSKCLSLNRKQDGSLRFYLVHYKVASEANTCREVSKILVYRNYRPDKNHKSCQKLRSLCRNF